MSDRLQAVGALLIGMLVFGAITPTILAGATPTQGIARVVVIVALAWTLVSAGYFLGQADKAKGSAPRDEEPNPSRPDPKRRRMIRAALTVLTQAVLLIVYAVLFCFAVGWCLGWVLVGIRAVAG